MVGAFIKLILEVRQLEIEAKDNITIIDTKNENEVIAVISEKEIIVKDGYEVLFDVGVEEPLEDARAPMA